jgi:hypothetical protein
MFTVRSLTSPVFSLGTQWRKHETTAHGFFVENFEVIPQMAKCVINELIWFYTSERGFMLKLLNL